MKKSTKLLSVLLAILMIFSSVSVLASAHITQYKTSADLENLKAYSANGEVTRLNTEDRLSILMDSVDQLLSTTNIYIPDVLNQLVGVNFGISITVDLRSINGLCKTLDSVKGALGNTIVKGIISGDLHGLTLQNWTSGMTRENTANVHQKIFMDLTHCLGDNASRIEGTLRNGIHLGGLAVAFDSKVAPINEMVQHLPKLIKGMLMPLMERVDNDQAWADKMYAATQNDDPNFEDIVEVALKQLLSESQVYSDYKEDANYNCISNHKLPDASAKTRLRFTLHNGKTINAYYTVEHYNPATKAWDIEKDEKGETVRYDRIAEKDAAQKPTGNYIYQVRNADGTFGGTIKYHTTDDVWVPSLAKDMADHPDAYNLQTASLASIFYRGIPFVFQDLAPVVLNGSIKKLLAEWFGAKFDYIAKVDEESLLTEKLGKDYKVGSSNDAIFTKAHEHYTFGWSDYSVLKNGKHVWRFNDDIYLADLSGTNPYFKIFNWSYKIDGTFFDQYLPKENAEKYDHTLFEQLNNFVSKFMKLVLVPDLYNQIKWEEGGNDKILLNAKKAAQAIIAVSPESVFGERYAEDEYYNYLMDPARLTENTAKDNQGIVCVIAAELLKLLMPQLILPSVADLKGQDVGAMFAYIIREVTTQLLPYNRYDDLIFSDYNSRTLLKNKGNDYWLDVCLTMGVDLGMHYLTELCDMGDDSNLGYKQRFPEGTKAKPLTYKASAFDQKGWEKKLDWFIDFALTDEVPWGWKGGILVDCGQKVSLATDEDPWLKLDAIFSKLGLFDQIFVANKTNSSMTWLEDALRNKLVLNLLNLNLEGIIGGTGKDGKLVPGLISVPADSILRTKGLFPMVEGFAINLVNNLFFKVARKNGEAGGNLIPGAITSINTLLNQNNLAKLVENLLQRLQFAFNNNKILDFAAPVLNHVVGWKTKRQDLAQPQINLINSAGKKFAYTGDNAKNDLKIYNASSGMLEKHGNKYDAPYVMTISSVKSSLGVTLNLPNTPYTLNPGESLNLHYVPTSAANNKAERIEVKYTVQLKNGTKSAEQTAYFYTFVTNEDTDILKTVTVHPSKTGGVQGDLSKVNASVVQNPTITDSSAFVSTVGKASLTISNGDAYPLKSCDGGKWNELTKQNTSYIEVSSDPKKMYPGQDKNQTIILTPLKARLGADLSKLVAGKKVALGQMKVTVIYDGWGSMNKGDIFLDFGSLHVMPNTAKVQALYDRAKTFQKSGFTVSDTEWNTFLGLMDKATELLVAPKFSKDFDDVAKDKGKSKFTQDKIDKLYNEFKAEIDKLDAAKSKGSTDALKEATDAVSDVNYQNYQLFEYFRVDNERKWNANMLNAYNAPVAPDKFIKDSNRSEADIKAKAEEAGTKVNDTLKQAILDTMQEPTEGMQNEYEAAKAAYKEPTYTDLQLADATAKVSFYAQFLKDAGVAVVPDNYFLQKEIDSAEAKQYVADKYSKDSWARYEKALAGAKAALNKKQSEMFDAKYELMLAQNKLVLKADSAKDNGYYALLNALIAQADEMFAHPASYTVKDSAKMTKEQAWAALVEALGYEWKDTNGVYDNLYPNSAKMFVANDRVIGGKTDQQINQRVKALKDAMALFETTYKLEAKQANVAVQQENKIINGITPASLTKENIANLVTFTTEGGKIVAASAKPGFYGTGTAVTLQDASKKALVTYTVVIYGDVNGDGAIDAFDASILDSVQKNNAQLNGAFALAADAVDDNQITAADYAAVRDAAKGSKTAIVQQRAGK